MTFGVGHAPTDTQHVGEKYAFSTALDRVVKEAPEHEELFLLMDANARPGRSGGGKLESEKRKGIGAYGRDTLNDNGEQLLSFSANRGVAHKFFSTTKNATSHTFNGRGKNVLTTLK